METKEMSNERKFEEVKREFKATTDWLNKSVKALDQETTVNLIDEILKAKRIFLMGAGRSGLDAKALAMRLTHLGFTVYVIGETTTPSIESDDLVIIVSGGGETDAIVARTRIILKTGARKVVITSMKDSTLGKLADVRVILPGRTKEEDALDYEERRLRGNPIAPLGTLFETICVIFIDSIITLLMILTGQTEEEMKKRHAKPD